jgi:DNA repair protein RadA/Sms
MITAVLSRRVGLKLGNQDVIVNATGGLRVREPAADLGIALAIASSFRDTPVDSEMAALGEVGLSGEMRAVSHLERRIAEVARMGFRRCLVPKTGTKNIRPPQGLELVPVASLREALGVGLGKEKRVPQRRNRLSPSGK